jgi:ribosomal protein S18 acetylase RimI-like enzyme
MSDVPGGDFAIRPARPDELPLLADIEIDAFATLAGALGVALDAHALPRSVLGRSLQENLLTVAVDGLDRPVAFLAGTEIESTLYVIELDVTRQWQRRGVGRRLVREAIATARMRTFVGVTLTTDRHVVFNAPFYRSLGFELLDEERLPQFLRNKLREEIEKGMDPDRRVAMSLVF